MPVVVCPYAGCHGKQDADAELVCEAASHGDEIEIGSVKGVAPRHRVALDQNPEQELSLALAQQIAVTHAPPKPSNKRQTTCWTSWEKERIR